MPCAKSLKPKCFLKMTEAIVLAGGLGTRLQKVVADVPKPMAVVNELPFLEYIFRYLLHYNFKSVILSVGYKHEVIKEYFGDIYLGMTVDYAVEDEPLGTGGAISLSLQQTIGNDVLVINGDTFFDVDLAQLYSKYIVNNADLAIALRQVDDVSRYGAVVTNEKSVMTNYLEKNASLGEGWINGGMYILRKSEFTKISFPQKYSFEKEYLEKLFLNGTIYGFQFKGYFIDIGIPEDYYRAQDEFKKFPY